MAKSQMWGLFRGNPGDIGAESGSGGAQGAGAGRVVAVRRGYLPGHWQAGLAVQPSRFRGAGR